jgi:hypothetical protein
MMLVIPLLDYLLMLIGESKAPGTKTFLEAPWLRRTRNSSTIHIGLDKPVGSNHSLKEALSWGVRLYM